MMVFVIKVVKLSVILVLRYLGIVLLVLMLIEIYLMGVIANQVTFLREVV